MNKTNHPFRRTLCEDQGFLVCIETFFQIFEGDHFFGDFERVCSSEVQHKI